LDSVRLRLRSDVPVGSCLSGGIDSSSVVCAVARMTNNKNINTFSAIFPGKDIDESRYIKDVVAILELAGRESLRGVFSYPCNNISMKLLAEIIIEILDSKSTIKYIDKNEDVLEAFYHNFLPFKQPYGLEEGIKDYAKWIKEEDNKC